MPELSPQRLHDLSPYADEDTLITQLLIAMLGQVVERHTDGEAAVFLEPLNRYEAYYLNTVGKAADLCRAADHTRIQLMTDLFHMNIEEADIPNSLRAVARASGPRAPGGQPALAARSRTYRLRGRIPRLERDRRLTAGWRWNACRRPAIRWRTCAPASPTFGAAGNAQNPNIKHQM